MSAIRHLCSIFVACFFLTKGSFSDAVHGGRSVTAGFTCDCHCCCDSHLSLMFPVFLLWACSSTVPDCLKPPRKSNGSGPADGTELLDALLVYVHVYCHLSRLSNLSLSLSLSPVSRSPLSLSVSYRLSFSLWYVFSNVFNLTCQLYQMCL